MLKSESCERFQKGRKDLLSFHDRESHPRDLYIRGGCKAPTTPTLLELAEEPIDLVKDLFADLWRPWIAFPCGDGRWITNVVTAIATYNSGGTDSPAIMGTVGMIAQFIQEKNWSALEFVAKQLEFAHEHHSIEGVQIITHPLCGGTKDEVCGLVKGGHKVYRSPTKVDLQLFLLTERKELEIHRRHCNLFRDWLFAQFPFINAVEYLRSTKWRLEPFSHHEEANRRAIDVLKARGDWEEVAA